MLNILARPAQPWLKLQLMRISAPWPRRMVLGLLLVLMARYLLWRTTSTLNFADPLTTGFSLGLWAAELLVLGNTVIQIVLAFNLGSDRTVQADRLSRDVLTGDYQPSVDVLIPTYNEPAFILRRTVMGAQGMEYGNFRVYLLDDSDRPEIQDLALELGCGYLARQDRSHAKAGNLNHALHHTSGELIVCFDADFIPTTNFLQRTVGFFQDAKTALVQTPQSFYNCDPIARNLGLENILPPEEEVFYRQVQPIRDAVGSVVCAGTSFVARRGAIAQAGGFVTDSLSEDYFTAIKLSSLGYDVLYLNEKLSAGLAAENIAAHGAQRLRWARGTLQAFFIKSNPLTIPGLSLKQRFGHLEGILHWFTGLSRLYFLLMPLAYGLGGIIPFKTTGEDLLYFFVPLYAFQLATFGGLNGRSRSAFFSEIYALILLVPIATTVIHTLISPFSKGFQVTPKGTSSDRFVFNLHLAWPLILLLLLNLYSMTLGKDLSLIWSGYNCLMLTITLIALVERPQPSPEICFAWRRRVQLTVGDRTYYGKTKIISETSCQIVLEDRGLEITAESVDLEILGMGLNLKGRVIASSKASLTLAFVQVSLEQQRRLVGLLFCRPGQWVAVRSPGELRSLGLLFKILLFPPLVWRRGQRALRLG
jgi:cellulose synthase (UDP-forming)